MQNTNETSASSLRLYPDLWEVFDVDVMVLYYYPLYVLCIFQCPVVLWLDYVCPGAIEALYAVNYIYWGGGDVKLQQGCC